MTLRQRRISPGLFNREPSRPITPLQILESIHRNPTRARGELQQPALLLGVPAADDLPEILDDLVRLRVAAIIGMLLPVLNVDVCDTADQELEFALVEDVDQIRRNKLVEAGDEGVELFLDTLLDAPFDHEALAVC